MGSEMCIRDRCLLATTIVHGFGERNRKVTEADSTPEFHRGVYLRYPTHQGRQQPRRRRPLQSGRGQGQRSLGRLRRAGSTTEGVKRAEEVRARTDQFSAKTDRHGRSFRLVRHVDRVATPFSATIRSTSGFRCHTFTLTRRATPNSESCVFSFYLEIT